MKHLHDVLCRTLIFSILIWTFLLSASAERVEYCDSIQEDFVDWNKIVSLPKFDPQMGTLRAVDLLLTMNISQEIMVENTNTQSRNFNSSLNGTLTADTPSSDIISININHSSVGDLPAYDGSVDFGGESGLKSVSQIPTETATKSISNIEVFLAKAPGENITIPVRTNIESTTIMPGTSSSGIITKAGAKVCVVYTYDARSEDGGPQ